MTNPTLERAARAVADATAGELTEGQNIRIARAVLMAVREPDASIWHKANHAAWLADKSTTEPAPEVVWPFAIEAILNDGEGE